MIKCKIEIAENSNDKSPKVLTVKIFLSHTMSHTILLADWSNALFFCILLKTPLKWLIADYAKMVDQERFNFYAVFTMIFCALRL